MRNDRSLLGENAIKPMEILLVEDGWTDARVTIYAVRRSQVHHRLTLVRSVAEAIAFLSQDGIFARAPRPDLLLLDMMLPDGTGLDVLKFLSDKACEELDLPKITTVALTASSDSNLREQCEDLGAADFMNKPVREEGFMRVVRDHKRLMVHTTPVLVGA